MPAPLEVDLYRLGIRLTQCRELHENVRGPRPGYGPEDIPILLDLIRSLKEAFDQYATTAGLGDSVHIGGTAIIAACHVLWERWQYEWTAGGFRPAETLFDEEYLRKLEQLESLVLNVLPTGDPAVAWFELGKLMVTVDYADSDDLGASSHAPSTLRYKYKDLKKLRALLGQTGLSLKHVFPRIRDRHRRSRLLRFGLPKYALWDRVEIGLVGLLQSVGRVCSPVTADSGAPSDSPAKDSQTESIRWRDGYLGLQLDDEGSQVTRRGYGPVVQLTRLQYHLLKALEARKDSPLSREKMQESWCRWGGGGKVSPGTIRDAVHKLGKRLQSLNVHTKGARNVGWTLVDTSSKAKAEQKRGESRP